MVDGEPGVSFLKPAAKADATLRLGRKILLKSETWACLLVIRKLTITCTPSVAVTSAKGVTYMMNSGPPSTEPCATPNKRWTTADVWATTWTDCVLLLKYDEDQLTAVPERPKQWDSLSSSIWWSIVSNAADRSRRTRALASFWFAVVRRSSNKESKAVSVEWLAL